MLTALARVLQAATVYALAVAGHPGTAAAVLRAAA